MSFDVTDFSSLRAHSDHTWRLPGVYSATVTDVADPLRRGRVRVRVPAILEQSTTWARPCFPYGHFFVPAVGDQAWVAFEGGDPGAPVWLGVWYPEDATPQLAGATPPAAQRLVLTESGHKLLFDDTSGSETMRIEDMTGNFVELSPGAMTIHSEQPLTIHSEQAVTIEAPGQAITVKAKSVDVQQG